MLKYMFVCVKMKERDRERERERERERARERERERERNRQTDRDREMFRGKEGSYSLKEGENWNGTTLMVLWSPCASGIIVVSTCNSWSNNYNYSQSGAS